MTTLAVVSPDDPDDRAFGIAASQDTTAAVEYETSLLAAVLTGYDDLPELTRLVGATDDQFASAVLGAAWEACCDVHRDGHRVEPVAVKDRMIKKGVRFDPLILITLVQTPGVVTASAPFYAERVRDMSRMRKIGDLGVRMVQASSRTDADPETVLGFVQAWAGDLLAEGGSDVIDVWSVLEDAIVEPGVVDPMITPTPFDSLDNLLGGMFPGQLIIIGARPGHGKSALAENISTEVARQDGLQSLYISMEMTARELVQRTLSWTARVPLTGIRTGRYTPGREAEEMERLAAATTLVAATPIEMIDRAHVTVDDIRAYAWAAKQRARRHGRRLAVVTIDYAGLVILPDIKNGTEQQAIGKMTRALKRLAKELEVTIILPVQLNRGVEGRADKRPMLSDLKSAGDYEQDADVVILLHQEQEEDQYHRLMPTGFTDLIVAKNRNGPQGTCTVQFFGEYTRFSERAM